MHKNSSKDENQNLYFINGLGEPQESDHDATPSKEEKQLTRDMESSELSDKMAIESMTDNLPADVFSFNNPISLPEIQSQDLPPCICGLPSTLICRICYAFSFCGYQCKNETRHQLHKGIVVDRVSFICKCWIFGF